MQKTEKNTGLVWFRNDLRVHDNCTLNKAISQNNNVIAVYCFNPKHYKTTTYGFKKTDKFRAKFIIESVTALKQNLKKLNIELFVYLDTPENVIPGLVDTFNVNSIFLQNEWTSEEVNTHNKVKAHLPSNIAFHEDFNQFLYHPDDIHLKYSEIHKVFTNFRKHVEKQSSVRAIAPLPTAITPTASINNTTKIPSLSALGFENFSKHPHTAFPFKGGENAALERLEYYIFKTQKLGVYKKTRNGLIGTSFSSKFSAWLAIGAISAKTIYWQVKKFEQEYYKNQSTYWLIFELIWRDYFKYIALKHGNNIFKQSGILQKPYQWETDSQRVMQWINGETPSPFVNANMLELKHTGWMSNRGRQNVASFFSKDLMLDWRIGAAYFESQLIDYDVHSNYGNWMYLSGVGNDPRDRKFNVDLQAQRYDPRQKFQNLWLDSVPV